MFVIGWFQLENVANFISAISAYGLKPHDIFEANDLFENGNMTQVQTTLLALASLVSLKRLPLGLQFLMKQMWIVGLPCTLYLLQAKTNGCKSRVDIGVKYADKQKRMFDEEKMKAGQCVIGLQVQKV